MAMSPFYDDHGEDDDPWATDDEPLDEWRAAESDDEQERREVSEHGAEDFG